MSARATRRLSGVLPFRKPNKFPPDIINLFKVRNLCSSLFCISSLLMTQCFTITQTKSHPPYQTRRLKTFQSQCYFVIAYVLCRVHFAAQNTKSERAENDMYYRHFFVHFFAGSLRPAACGALSFQGKKLSFGSKNISFFHTGSFFGIFNKEKPALG